MRATSWTGNRGVTFAGALGLAAALVLAGCDSSNVGSDAYAVAGLTVNVVYQGETRAADLSKSASVQIGGMAFVVLSDVVTAAFPDIDLTRVAADFQAGDGFRPGSKANCAALIPVPGTLLAQGYISPETRNLAWGDSLQYPGCMRVSDTAQIDLADQ